MPVSNEHLKDTVRVWDGIGFQIVSSSEAKRLEKEGLIQVTTNLQAKDLLSREELSERAKPKKKPKTRQMKPQSGGKGYQTKVITPDECAE